MDKKINLSRPKQCYFCHPKDGFGYMKRVYKYEVQFFGKWNNFYIMPMVGAGIDGYLLIFHKDHYHSLADIPSDDILSLRKLLNIIKKEIAKVYGSSIIFEHGSTCDNVSCLIDHAHIHVVPVPKGFDVVKEIEQDFELTSIKNYSDIGYWGHGELGRLQYKINNNEIDKKTARESFSPFSGYLYYENTSGKMLIHEIKDLYCFQPQYLRMVVLKKIGIDKWEWNKNIDPECQRRTLEKLQGLSRHLTPFKINGSSI